MDMGNRAEILMGIKHTAQEERKVTVFGLDDMGNPADRMESVLVYEARLVQCQWTRRKHETPVLHEKE
jgi:hypothetical protein